MESTNLVVRQDKGNGSLWPVGPCFAFALRPFSEGHYDTPEVIVTRAEWVTVTRAICGGLSGGWSRTRRVLFVMVTVIAGAVLPGLAGRFLHLRIMLTDSSAAAGIYRVTDSPAARGALVAVCLPPSIARQGLARGYLQPGDCPAGAEPVAKIIGALPGDVVELESGWIAVNGVKFPNSRTAPRDSADRPLPHVPSGARRAGSGEVWLFGFNDARSWDARYFGAVPAANLRGVLKPVVTW
jgi:conjugative transfer signal peptidase TraF